MTDDDRRRWDERYRNDADPSGSPIKPAVPTDFAEHAHHFPTSGRALELACGTGSGCLWLAQRGLDVVGVDVSKVAVDAAAGAAHRLGLADRCRFLLGDLDDGLPDTPLVDLVMCHRFRDPALYTPMLDRLAAGGLLAVAVLSEVDSAPGRYRAKPGELRRAFADRLRPLVDREQSGYAVFIGRAGSTG